MRTFVCLLLPLLLLLGSAAAADDGDDGEPSSPAQQVAAGVSPTPLADMASGAAQALFGDAGPPAKRLPQGQGARVDCGVEGTDNAAAWCAPLLKEHFHAGLDQSRKASGAREAAYYGKHAPIDMGAKEDTGGRLPPWEVMRGLVFGADYVLACSFNGVIFFATAVRPGAFGSVFFRRAVVDLSRICAGCGACPRFTVRS